MTAKIENYMTPQPHSIRPGETLKNAQAIMEKFSIRHLPVLERGSVIGLITERDFALIHLYPEMDLEHSTVEELMLQNIYQVGPQTPLTEVVGEMSRKKVGSAIIVDDAGGLIGIFTAIDALNLVGELINKGVS